ncbi:MAG: hypothetical protein GKR97_06060 [Rhizobiaceae bacterium]|nr:hypothetical protein [Rhizobiaceae bacterium]
MLAKNDAENRVTNTVLDTITDLLQEQGLDSGGVEESAKLVDTLGLKSMDIAQIVLFLEDELDADPFQEIPITSVRTVGDLINAYRVTLNPGLAADPELSLNKVASDAPPPLPPSGGSRRANRRR